MMKIKKVLAAIESENEFDVDEPEEVGNNSQDKWAPIAIAKTSGKRGRPAKSTPARKKKIPNVSDNKDEKEIPPKKERGSKAKPRPSAPIPSSSRGRGRTTQVLNVKPEEDDNLEEEDEEDFNQGPNAKPAKKFTNGAFVVLKTDMIVEDNPPVWRIGFNNALLKKYIPFKQDGKVVYKNTTRFSFWNSKMKYQYYSAPVSFIRQTKKEHIIEFYKDKIKKDLKVEEAAKKKVESADDDDEKE